VIVGAALAVILAVLLLVPPDSTTAPIDDLAVTADAHRSCDDALLHANFRLDAPTTVTFWLLRKDVKTYLGARQLEEGDQAVDLQPEVTLSPSGGMKLVASTADHHLASAGFAVDCSKNQV
jgi:hypothetical protein